ncbi:hypothetical protein BJ322DRAFT_1021236 [Thelephora terrestris]|uniref:Uncharacterized protein n=1 Tax=Thelephora terrestris TaxID=56493 RepID=A0A9P6L6I3_9AGAM|nr:hypothetical protein BJ322DRAFT_1021236 [Thelephora terrestris]
MFPKTLRRSQSTLAFPTNADFKTEKELLKYYYKSKDARLALLQAVQQEQGNTEAIVYFNHHLLYSPITIYPDTTEDYRTQKTYTSEIMGVKLVYYIQDPKTHQWELAINPTPPSSDEYNRYDTVPLIDYMGQGWKTDVEALEYLKTKKSARKLISRQAWTYMYQGAGVMYIVHPLFEVPLVLGPHDSEESILRKVTIRLDTLKRVADKYPGNV